MNRESYSAVNQTHRHPFATTDKYRFVPTTKALKVLADHGRNPVKVQQARVEKTRGQRLPTRDRRRTAMVKQFGSVSNAGFPICGNTRVSRRVKQHRSEGGGAVPLDFDDKLWMYQGSSCSGSATTITNKDLALVRFKNNKPNAHVRVATVASNARLQRALNDPFSYWIVGFGYQRNRNRYGVYELGDIGQKAYGYVFRTSECTGDASALPRGCLQSKEIVLSDSGTQVDTCAGDSGGPAYVLAANDASFRLVAITSRSTSPSGACGPGGIYGLIDTDAVDWIEEKLRESGEGTSAAIDRQN